MPFQRLFALSVTSTPIADTTPVGVHLLQPLLCGTAAKTAHLRDFHRNCQPNRIWNYSGIPLGVAGDCWVNDVRGRNSITAVALSVAALWIILGTQCFFHFIRFRQQNPEARSPFTAAMIFSIAASSLSGSDAAALRHLISSVVFVTAGVTDDHLTTGEQIV